MDFFKSVFTDGPDPPKPEADYNSADNPDPKSPQESQQTPESGANVAGGWIFGGLIKTITTRSESVIETYRRDLKEFGSGLKKEMEVAQGSLGTVSHAIDEFGSSVLKGTAQIINQGKDAILAMDNSNNESDTSSDNNANDRSVSATGGQDQGLSSKRYNRFDAQVRAMQVDAGTYCDEPEDGEDYGKWRSGFVLEEKKGEMERLLQENGAMESVYKRVVPGSIDEETFWCRYYYRVYKLKQAEDLRAKLVKRAISREEEELTWDVDDEDEDEDEEEEDERNFGSKAESNGSEDLGRKDSSKIVKDEASGEIGEVEEVDKKESEQRVDSNDGKMGVKESREEVNVKEEEKDEKSVGNTKEEKISSGVDNVGSEKVDTEKGNEEESSPKPEERVDLKAKEAANGESGKGKESSVVLSQQSVSEEEDLGWDEIEDLSSIDEKRVSHSENLNKADLRKRLSTAEDEEDLSWDIEDDDGPVKA